MTETDRVTDREKTKWKVCTRRTFKLKAQTCRKRREREGGGGGEEREGERE